MENIYKYLLALCIIMNNANASCPSYGEEVNLSLKDEFFFGWNNHRKAIYLGKSHDGLDIFQVEGVKILLSDDQIKDFE